jgi:hypothetical protein
LAAWNFSSQKSLSPFLASANTLAKNTIPILHLHKCQPETRSNSQVIFITLLFTNLSKVWKIAGLKPFCWAKLACFHFSSSNFNLQHHILRTRGIASMKFNINFDVWMQPHWDEMEANEE